MSDSLLISWNWGEFMFSLSMKGENMRREETKVVQIGNCKIGGGNPIAIQSMTNTKTEDVEATVAQILALEAAGCDIIRCAVPTMEAAEALTEIKKKNSYSACCRYSF